MNTKSIALIALCCTSIALVGCGDKGGSAPVGEATKVEKFPEGAKVAELFPASVGTQSTYESTNSNSTTKGELSLRVSDSQKVGDVTKLKIEVLDKDKVTDVVDWEISSKGIFQTTARKGVAYNPPQLAVSPDFKSLEEIKYKGTGPYPSVETGKETQGPIEGMLRNRGIETVDTAMGQIEALAVESVYGYKAGGKQYRTQITTWFAPKYGIVRLVQMIQREDMPAPQTTTLKLKAFRTK
ncbi:hypothetical protein C0431_00905 [bacterium]|jgi:hypothetical protein|nr:hypothetical protein [bacterium]